MQEIKKDLGQFFYQCPVKKINPVVISTVIDHTTHYLQKKLKKKTKKQIGKVTNGILGAIPVSIIQIPMGAPNAAIFMEVMHQRHPDLILRWDVCGTLDPEILIGDVITVTTALVGEGTSAYYFRKLDNKHENCAASATTEHISQFQEVFIHETKLVKELLSAIEVYARKPQNKDKIHPDVMCWTTDALFCESVDEVACWKAQGAQVVDMETSLMYYLAMRYDLSLLSIMGVVDAPNTEYDLLYGTKFSRHVINLRKNMFDILDELFPHIQTYLNNPHL